MIDVYALSLAVGALTAIYGFIVRMIRNGALPSPTVGDGVLFIFPLLFAAVLYFMIAFDIGNNDIYVLISRAVLSLFIVSALYLNRCTYKYTIERIRQWMTRQIS